MEQKSKRVKRNSLTALDEKPIPEKTSGISQTIPDHAMSIFEIMQRHSRGMAITQKVPLYHDEAELETETGRNPATMDISEVHDELQSIHERFEETKKKSEEQRKQKQREDSAKREQEQREKWIKEHEEQKQKNQKP